MTTRPLSGPRHASFAMLALLCMAAQADPTSIANVPLSTQAVKAKPNIMFILDDSGSMDSRYMPDEMSGSDRYGFWSAQCNGVAYNPNIEYTPPVDYLGNVYPNATFTDAWRDGFNTSGPTSTTTNLDNAGDFDNRATYYRYTGSQPALSWTYLASGSIDTGSTFYAECQTPIGSAGPFTAVRVTSASAEAQNYANWFAYYRTRIAMMRTATGRAFNRLNGNFRVGFSAISDPTVTSTQFLDIADFDDVPPPANASAPSQKSKFYDKLYSVYKQDYTPLRGALAKIGQYYGKTAPGQTYDPMQYSCQRSYAILSTDGYWNANIENATYGPYKLDGALVGQQDGDEARPMRDDPSRASTNSLADVAEYYWRTDLRADLADNVPVTSGDSNRFQHMNTFTVGLAQRGTLKYDPNYLTQTRGDFADLKSGVKNWPDPGSGEGATRIDDLWHAAVNGRGQYFSAADPRSLAAGLTGTLARITEQNASGSGAAAGGSTLTPVAGDDWIFLPSFTNQPTWSGDLRAFKFTFSAGAAVLPDTSKGQEIWSAAAKLDARDISRTPRKIYFNNRGALSDFSYDNLRAAGLNGAFDGRCTTAAGLLSQCSAMESTPKAKVTGSNLVAFLAGDTSLYLNATDAANRVFRTRASRLGDFVNASPAYVGKPPFKYADAGYASFVAAKANRTKMVYAAGNDGMLHAFVVEGDATGGTELWAFVPTAVMSELWHLADAGYDGDHRYFVDATPVVGDVYDGTQWRTVLIGGLGAGGRSYYALDITDPAYPALLWEYNASGSDANLGLTYGNPILTKNAAGTWVVAFTSGLNNVSPGDGVGRLYVLNALTGARLTTVVTDAGSVDTPSNLSRIEGWVVAETNNTTQRFYGGDMLGNLWRFDYDNQIAPFGNEAFKLGIAQSASGTAQPITSKPVLSELQAGGNRVAVVSFGTGRFLGTPDLTSADLQSIYAVKDSLGATSLGVLRASGANLVKQTLGGSRVVNTLAPVDWGLNNGWFVDLDVADINRSYAERVVLDGAPLAPGVLGFASIKPGNNDVCVPGGSAYLYQFDLGTGKVTTVTVFNTLVAGLGRVVDPMGEVNALVTRADQTLEKKASTGGSTPPGGFVKRATWRELTN